MSSLRSCRVSQSFDQRLWTLLMMLFIGLLSTAVRRSHERRGAVEWDNFDDLVEDGIDTHCLASHLILMKWI